MSTGDQVLAAWLRERIRARGPIPFVEFMDAALYHPEAGYYCRPGATTGTAGDYYTSPDLHPAFGRLLSRQIAEIADRTSDGRDGSFHIIEAGPGTGRLARDIIAALASERPDLARRTRYVLVEISPSLRRSQSETIEAGGRPGDVTSLEWASWPALLERVWEGGFAGCVVANEFLDALPVHAVERREGRLREVHVALEDGAFREVLLDPASDRLEPHLAGLGIELQEGQRAEIGLRALDWVSSLGRLFGASGRGGAILIDYGHPARELYSAARSRGTLMCYHRPRASDEPYARVGEQDMTAHVDFTSVERAARAGGFEVAPLRSQMRFLVALGLAQMLAEIAASADAGVEGARDRLALHGLMTPGGMGEIFKVLLLAKGAPASDLRGAKDPFR